ncbi:hypothetical protein [Haloterrigena gelatinilytica]|uniref:hypothetical protein n=1 Tax=Haloterrigena gelatinilytica TaxID=2741724 RepID=UPI002811FE1D|nr:hypothetical protein [Haloterrigena gelatinilytica]
MSAFGTDSEEIVRTGWTGREFRGLEGPLQTVVTRLAIPTENHKAYPILHYFHSARRDRSPIVEIVVLDEALTLVRFGVPSDHRSNELTVRSARTSVEHYLETLHEGVVEPADGPPPRPDLRSLREGSIPTASGEAFETALD